MVTVLRRELAVTPLALLAASAVLLTVSGRETGAARTVPTPGDPHAIESLTTSASTGQAPSPFAIRERVLASIVGVRATLAQPQLKFTGKRRIVAEVTPSKGTGSGIVVDSAGLILTCAHVIGGAGKVRVFLADDREVEGTVTVYDTTSDLALLRVDAGPLPALDVHTGGALREEQAVFLGARPGGAEIRFFEGKLAAAGVFHIGHSQLEFFRQFSGPIEPGDSGGALVDAGGRLVGIVSVGLPGRNLGYAIAREFVLVALARFRAGAPVVWPWLGLAVETAPDQPGARVWSVVPRSPAAAAGLRAGDRLLSIDGRPIDHFLSAMLHVVSRPVGARFDLVVRRAKHDPAAPAPGFTAASGPATAPRSAPSASNDRDDDAPTMSISLYSAPRSLDPVIDPLDLFEKETGIRLEPVPPSGNRPKGLRAASVPPARAGEHGYGVGSRLVGLVPGLNLVRELEEGRTDQELRTTTVSELGQALGIAAVGEHVAAALLWNTDGQRSTTFLSGEARRFPIL